MILASKLTHAHIKVGDRWGTCQKPEFASNFENTAAFPIQVKHSSTEECTWPHDAPSKHFYLIVYNQSRIIKNNFPVKADK